MTAPEPELALARLMAAAARGPRKDGTFAVWLAVRVAADIAIGGAMPERAQRKRVQALEKRLSSLTLPAPLRRALAGTIAALREVTPGSAQIALSQLIAPARESLGGEVGDAVQRAARIAANPQAR